MGVPPIAGVYFMENAILCYFPVSLTCISGGIREEPVNPEVIGHRSDEIEMATGLVEHRSRTDWKWPPCRELPSLGHAHLCTTCAHLCRMSNCCLWVFWIGVSWYTLSLCHILRACCHSIEHQLTISGQRPQMKSVSLTTKGGYHEDQIKLSRLFYTFRTNPCNSIPCLI